MANIYGTLHIGRQALAAQQEALNVTAHNIANVNTEGYSRQRVVTETTAPITTGAGQVGTGVTVSGVERVYDRHLAQQISDENETFGRWEAEKNGLDRAEVVLNEASGYGLNQAMSDFWDAWQDLVNNPSGAAEREMVAWSGENLALNFERIHNDLSQIQNDMNSYVSQTVDGINFKAEQIAAINEKIVKIETSEGSANDLRDKRDVWVNELAKMIDITYHEEGNGSYTIKLGDDRSLVEGATSNALATDTNGSGFEDVVWEDDNADVPISDGKLKGYMEVRDAAIPGYKDDLEELSEEIKDAVNDIHQDGYGLDGTPGEDFFTGSLAGNDFAISSTISEDVTKIAASGTELGVPGDNQNAIEIAELQNALKMNSDTATFDDFYNGVVSGVGVDVQQAYSSYSHQEAMVNYLDDYREAVSGVSLDEEMVNMLQFEAAYQAAARTISSVDKMLETLMTIV
ncbi:MAG: flagellar hook-associated protein FlgK [Desulfatiglandaceae bacterium]